MKTVPRWAWIALAVVIALVAGTLYHRHEVHQFKVEIQRAQMAADNDHWRLKLQDAHKDAMNWKAQYEQEQTTIANEERTRHEENVRNNDAFASTLSLHGPGAASAGRCRPLNSTLTGTAAGSNERAAGASAASGGLLAEDGVSGLPASSDISNLALVPWGWLTDLAKDHDNLLSEVVAWRNDYVRRLALYQRSVQPTAPVKR